MSRFPVPIPPSEIIRLFDDVVGGAAELAASLGVKNRTLAATRDLLLPRLISGELSVAAAPDHRPRRAHSAHD